MFGTAALKVVVGSLTLACALSGCSGGAGARATSDCAAQVRAGGIVYTSYGYTGAGATRHAMAERAECEDVGGGAPGSVFPGQPQQVTTWAFSGHPTDDVLGVRVDERTFAVFVAGSVPAAEGERILRDLGRR